MTRERKRDILRHSRVGWLSTHTLPDVLVQTVHCDVLVPTARRTRVKRWAHLRVARQYTWMRWSRHTSVM